MERDNDSSAYITTTQALESLYGPVATPSMLKEVDHIHPVYQPFIEAASFVILASSGPGGLDASPRGDAPGFVHVHDSKTLYLPDRPGLPVPLAPGRVIGSMSSHEPWRRA